MTTTSELRALACEDCPAEVSVQRGRGLLGRVLVVTVVHAGSCPWMARVAPGVDERIVTAPGRLLRHVRDWGTDAG